MIVQSSNVDPITMEVVQNALGAIVDEMALVIMRTAYSTIVRDSMDYSTGVCDRQGRIVAHGMTMALHLGSFPDAMAALIRDYGDDMHPGDMFIWNDPIRAVGNTCRMSTSSNRSSLGTNWRVLPHHWCTRSTWAVSRPAPPRCTPAKFFRKACASHRSSFMSGENRTAPSSSLWKEHPYSGQAGRGYAGTGRGLPNRRCRTDQPDRAIRQRHLPADRRRTSRSCRTHHAHRDIALPDGTWSFTDYIDGLGEAPEPIPLKVTITIDGGNMTLD